MPSSPRAHADRALNAGAIIANVGPVAGGPYPRAAIGVMLIGIALAAARLLSQSSPAARPVAPPDEMLAELAARINAAIAPTPQVSIDAADVALQAAVSARISASGVQVVDARPDVLSIRVACLDNLRDLVCSADVIGSARTQVMVARPHESLRSAPPVRVALTLRPIVALDHRILDVARSDDEMLVLTPDAVLRYEDERDNWRLAESAALSVTRPWPRDMRGRLRLASRRLEVFLPGVTCAGSHDPLTLTCAEGSAAWPIDTDDAYLDPLRNHFTTRDGLAFYGAARLSTVPGRLIAATLDHRLTFVTDNTPPAATLVRADDVAGVQVPCVPAGLIVASIVDEDGGALGAFEVVQRSLLPVTPPLRTIGDVTALWSTGGTALVVTHHADAGRYVANELSFSCSR
jgi:hypothetical protein